MANWSIRSRLFLFVGLAMLPVAGLLAAMVFSVWDSGRREAVREAAEHQKIAAVAYERQFLDIRSLLMVLATQPEFRAEVPSECSLRLAAAAGSRPAIAAIGLIARNGDLICRGEPFEGTLNVSDRDFVREVLATQAAGVGAPLVSRITGQFVIPVAVPVFRPGDPQVYRVLYATVTPATLAEITQDLELAPGTSLELVDHAGVIIDRVPDEPGLKASIRDSGLLGELSIRDAGTFEAPGADGASREFAFSRLAFIPGNPLYLLLGLPSDQLFATVQDTARNVILLSLLVLGLVFWSLTVATRRLVAEPYAALAATAQRLALGDFAARTSLPHDRSEAGTLAAAIDGMAAALANQREERDAAARVRLQLAEERAAHAAADRESQRVQALLDANPDPLVVVDAEGLVVAVNRRTEACFGYDRGELLGQPVETLVPDPQRSGHGALSAEYLKDPQPRLMTARQVRGLRRDGTAFPAEITLSPVELAEGVVVIASVRDVTDRREAEEQLQQSEERFRLLFNLTLDGVLEIDPEDGRIFAANPAACAMLGSTPDQLQGLTRPDYTDPTDPRLAEAIQERGRTGQYRSEFTLRRRDGTAFEAEVSSVVYQTEPGEPRASLIVRDITQRRALEAANQAARVAAEAANRAKSEFLSRMSHELRTPLNAVLGFAQLLELDPLSEEQRDSVDHISRAGRHLLQLINEVLDIARIEAGNLELSLEPVAVATALEEAIGLTRPLADRAGLTVALKGIDSGLYVRADRHRLHQVLLNLLSNAVKYNRPGGSVTVSQSLVGDLVRVQVDDTGAGIPRHRLTELFEPFNRLGAERTEIEGSGIGLAVTRRLMEAMGGKIGVESTVGTGTSFWVDLPRTDPPELRQATDGSTTAPAPPVELPAVTLLYIEDNLSNLSLVTRLVERWPQVRLLSALQGRLGLELAMEQGPDLILLDLHLPDLPGDEVLARLQGDPQTSGIPVVMLSADASPNRVKHLIGMGARAYLTKPLDLRELIKLIDEVAGGRSA